MLHHCFTWRDVPRVTSHSLVWRHNPSYDITLLILCVIRSVFLSWTFVQTWVPYTFLLCCRLTSNLCHTVMEHSLDLECAHAELWPCDFNPKILCSDDWLNIWISWTNFGSLYCVDGRVLRKITRYQITWLRCALKMCVFIIRREIVLCWYPFNYIWLLIIISKAIFSFYDVETCCKYE